MCTIRAHYPQARLRCQQHERARPQDPTWCLSSHPCVCLSSLSLFFYPFMLTSLSRHYSTDLKNLIQEMFNKNPKLRPNVNEILKRPFIQKRIQTFLTTAVFDQEFSHTVLHGKYVLSSPHTLVSSSNNRCSIEASLAAAAAKRDKEKKEKRDKEDHNVCPSHFLISLILFLCEIAETDSSIFVFFFSLYLHR